MEKRELLKDIFAHYDNSESSEMLLTILKDKKVKFFVNLFNSEEKINNVYINGKKIDNNFCIV